MLELANSSEASIREEHDINISEELTQLAENLSLGKGTREISGLLSRSEQWVRKHKKDPDVMRLVHVLQNESIEATQRSIKHLSTKAIERLDQLLDSKNKSISLAAFRDVLKMNDFGPKSDAAPGSTINIFNDVAIGERKKALNECLTNLNVEYTID